MIASETQPGARIPAGTDYGAGERRVSICVQDPGAGGLRSHRNQHDRYLRITQPDGLWPDYLLREHHVQLRAQRRQGDAHARRDRDSELQPMSRATIRARRIAARSQPLRDVPYAAKRRPKQRPDSRFQELHSPDTHGLFAAERSGGRDVCNYYELRRQHLLDGGRSRPTRSAAKFAINRPRAPRKLRRISRIRRAWPAAPATTA